MTTDWTDLPDLQAVAKAQAEDWEIQENWILWSGSAWYSGSQYRARPRQPKMKKVRMLAYWRSGQLVWFQDDTEYPEGSQFWIRIPAQDIEIEIPEGV